VTEIASFESSLTDQSSALNPNRDEATKDKTNGQTRSTRKPESPVESSQVFFPSTRHSPGAASGSHQFRLLSRFKTVIPTGAQRSGGTRSCSPLHSQILSKSESPAILSRPSKKTASGMFNPLPSYQSGSDSGGIGFVLRRGCRWNPHAVQMRAHQTISPVQC
jgi:hypothetical protein